MVQCRFFMDALISVFVTCHQEETHVFFIVAVLSYTLNGIECNSRVPEVKTFISINHFYLFIYIIFFTVTDKPLKTDMSSAK